MPPRTSTLEPIGSPTRFRTQNLTVWSLPPDAKTCPTGCHPRSHTAFPSCAYSISAYGFSDLSLTHPVPSNAEHARRHETRQRHRHYGGNTTQQHETESSITTEWKTRKGYITTADITTVCLFIKVYALGVPGYTFWGYPGIYPGGTRIYTL